MNRYKILIVDDLAENIQILSRCYEDLCPDYVLYQATSGKAAFELAVKLNIDIIVSDWEMPGMSGIDLITAIKAEPKTTHIPIIIVTGILLSPSDLKEALSAGAYDYLRKPVDSVELAARTNSALLYVKMHQRELAAKDLELTEKTMLMARYNQFNQELVKKLKAIENIAPMQTQVKQLVTELMNDIEQNAAQAGWKHFEMAFQNVYPEFSKTVTEKFPDLTPGDLRHLILIRLGLSNKDMASMLYQSPDSIKVNRSRIRKKLGISNETNLQTFLIML